MQKMRWQEYFEYSRKERVAIFILILAITIVFLAPVLISKKFQAPEQSAKLYQEMSKEFLAMEKQNLPRYEDEPTDLPTLAYHATHFDLFKFDPNTLSADRWKKLGVGEHTIRTIEKYISKGGRFRKPEDISKIYGMRPELANRLMPYVNIPDLKESSAPKTYDRSNAARSFTRVEKPPHIPELLDINTADTGYFISLPGIGSKLAARIVNFRDKLGGFYSVEQLAETYGLPDSTYQLIKPRLICGNAVVRRININDASLEDLKNHPYIKWNLANVITQYRKQHGPFTSTDQLEQLLLLSKEQLVKLLPYLSVE